LKKPDVPLTEKEPRLKWLQDAENDLRELKVKRLKQEKNKEEWDSAAKEAKILRGQWRKG
jgi:hypothetical protein